MKQEAGFTKATLEIEDLIEKKKRVLGGIANQLAEACVARAKQNNVTPNIINDVKNQIKSLPLEDQVDVLSKVVYELAKTGRFGSNNTTNRDNDDEAPEYMSEIFSGRRRR